MITLSSHINRFLRRLLLVLLVAGPGSSLYAAKDTVGIQNDSSAVLLRQPDPVTQEQVYRDEDWKYVTEEQSSDGEKSFFDRLLDDLLESLTDQTNEPSTGSSSGGPNFNWLTLFFIILGAALLVFFIIKATGTGGNLLFKGKSKRKENVDATLEDVDIHAIDYDAQIAMAKSKNDYRFAVRLWFLRSLKEMADLELIRWKIDKTNSDYYYELSGNNLQKQFGSVSLLYDYIWYGDFEINELKYGAAENDLRSFYSDVKKSPVKK
ncbi:MAG TPA: hypothetical protein VK826_16240 [Bacteroidia bacterium]|nr:hypothetical protein [Bacteroidia bacterium]